MEGFGAFRIGVSTVVQCWTRTVQTIFVWHGWEKKEPLSRAYVEPARGFMSNWKPSNVLLTCARGMQQKIQHISGLRHIWHSPSKAFVLPLIFKFRDCYSNHITWASFYCVWHRHITISKTSEKRARLNRIYKRSIQCECQLMKSCWKFWQVRGQNHLKAHLVLCQHPPAFKQEEVTKSKRYNSRRQVNYKNVTAQRAKLQNSPDAHKKWSCGKKNSLAQKKKESEINKRLYVHTNVSHSNVWYYTAYFIKTGIQIIF